MLEAFYDKTCLAKCFGNCLEMHFKYLHVSVAQKTDQVTNTWLSEILSGQFGKTLGTLWEYSGDTFNVL